MDTFFFVILPIFAGCAAGIGFAFWAAVVFLRTQATIDRRTVKRLTKENVALRSHLQPLEETVRSIAVGVETGRIVIDSELERVLMDTFDTIQKGLE